MSHNRRIDTENMVHSHNGVLFNYKKEDIMSFAGTWMELKNIILSEVTQTQRYAWYVLTNKWIVDKNV